MLNATDEINQFKMSERTRAKAWRASLSVDEHHKKSQKINESLGKVLKQSVEPTQWVASFKPFNSEVAISEIEGYSFCYPVVDGGKIYFYSSKDFQANSMGIMEPSKQNRELVAVDKIAAVIVPGLAFDHSGARLGYGGGYYDQFLAGIMVLKIGVGYAGQISKKDLKTQTHDINMDIIITENYILEFMSERSQWIKAH